jgi:hypothetical protein
MLSVTIPLVESSMPAYVEDGGKTWATAKNLITNGSFEYGGYFVNWTAANERDMTLSNFDVVNYAESDSVYLQSKADGDESSAKSIRTLWKISANKTYAFGYRIKNSTDIQSVSNSNVSTSLVKLDPSLYAGADDFIWDDDYPDSVYFRPMPIPMSGDGMSLVLGYPSYDGNWTDVTYVFTNTEGYSYLQFMATHMSENGNNTCLDNFFLSEVTDVTAVGLIKAATGQGEAFDMSGRPVEMPVGGYMIIDGKAYYKK